MTEITSDRYRQRGLPELRLDAFKEHQRINDLKKICIRQISEIRDVLGEDYSLLADFYAELSADLYDGLQEATINQDHQDAHNDDPIFHQEILDALNQYCNDVKTVEQTTPRELTAWDFCNKVLSKTAASEKLWWIQQSIHGCPTGIEGMLDGSSDQVKRFVTFLQNHAGSLCEIEEEILQEIEKAGFRYENYRDPWIADSSIDEIREISKKILFSDYHVFNGYQWHNAFMSVAQHCVRALDSSHLKEIISIRDELPNIFSGFFPKDFDLFPKIIEDFREEIHVSLKRGLPLSEAREIAARHDLKRYDFVIKTWLDRLATEKKIRKGVLNGRVAYWDK